MDWKVALESNKPRNQILAAIKRSPCATFLGSGASARDGVYKVCFDTACKRCVALKLSTLGFQEARIHIAIQEAVRSSVYSSHVAQLLYARAIAESKTEQYAIVTRFVEGRKTLYDVAPRLSVSDLEMLLVQIFQTLSFLHSRIRGFVHMDLKTDNIAIVTASGTETLGPWRLPNLRVSAVILDFGHSVSRAYPDEGLYGKSTEYYGCTKPVYDIFKLLFGIRELVRGASAAFIKDLFEFCFGTQRPFPLQKPYFNPYYHLPQTAGCNILPNLSYESVLRHRAFEKYRKR
jgi:serine/threonine protein kinase